MANVGENKVKSDKNNFKCEHNFSQTAFSCQKWSFGAAQRS